MDDITALVKGRNKDVAEMAKKSDEKAEKKQWRRMASSCQSQKMGRKGRAR